MEVSSAQIYLQQILSGLADPKGMMLAVCMLTLCAAVVITNSARWYALTLALFAISCAPPFNKYIVHVDFFFPVEFLRNWSRPIAFGMLLVVAVGAVRFERGTRQKLLPNSFWWFVAFQLITSLRMLTTYYHFQRGLWSICIIGLLVLIALMSLAPAVQSLRDANYALWAVAAVGMMAIAATLIQWRISPTSVQHNGRLFGTTQTPQMIGALLALTLPTMCYLLVRRRQSKSVAFNIAVFGVFIPLGGMLVIWTGARGTALAVVAGLVGFFHRRLGRFVVAAVICLVIAWFLAPYVTDAFQVSDRFFSLENTRAAPWEKMFTAIGRNPWFGQIPDTADLYAGYTVGEGAFLMSLSVYGIIGSLPLFFSFICAFLELQKLWRHRSVIPELGDLVDILVGFWLCLIVLSVFDSFILSYFTLVPVVLYVMFVLQGYAIDAYNQAQLNRQLGFEAASDPTHAGYADEYASVA